METIKHPNGAAYPLGILIENESEFVTLYALLNHVDGEVKKWIANECGFIDEQAVVKLKPCTYEMWSKLDTIARERGIREGE